MISRKTALGATLIFLIGMLFGSYVGAAPGLVTMNSSVGLLDITLVVAAVLGPFLAVDRASSFISRDIRTEIACAQQYKIIDDIDRLIRKLIHSTSGKTSINTNNGELANWLKLVTKLEYLVSSPWLPQHTDLIALINALKTDLGEAISASTQTDDTHTKIINAISKLSQSRQKIFREFIREITPPLHSDKGNAI